MLPPYLPHSFCFTAFIFRGSWGGILCSINLAASNAAGSAPARATLLSVLPQPLLPIASQAVSRWAKSIWDRVCSRDEWCRRPRRPVGGGRDRPDLDKECWCLPVFTGLVAPLENATLSPAWVLVESRARSQVPEDFAASLPLPRRCFHTRRATAWPSAPQALPAGSKGHADGLHCERESIQGSVLRETPAARERGGARLLSDSQGTSPAEPWSTRLPARRSRRCWTGHTGCAGAWRSLCVARGHVSTAIAQLRWEGAVSGAGEGWTR